ncbi:phospholipase D-like domain-containing protein [Rhodospirillaceae bacterium SYSU D60014]|uniref:phospholipase D-like domain-containing protein n=1 Tax=Virgifigura deserti TaxID=2268457 RepID=UPI000E65EC7B
MNNSEAEVTGGPAIAADEIGGVGLPGEASRLLEIGSTCWRIEGAHRAAFIVDTAAYFVAVKAAMWKARHSILILGWDFDPRVRLEPDNPTAKQPDIFGALLKHLAAERESLRIHVLIWDMALPIALQRRLIPQRSRRWLQSDRVRYWLDDHHPVGASHHQKIVVVDDAIAFSGGMDFAGNRWDTPAHRDADPCRRTPEGRAYEPRHDVMMVVDGAAAAALGDLARERWYRATGVRLAPPPVRANDSSASAPWPDGLKPELTNLPIGIARTEPAWQGRAEVRENEALYLKAIAAARRWIYLESQYFASFRIADALAIRLAEPDGPDVVVLCPAHSPSAFEQIVMDPARNLLIRRVRAADRFGRFQIYAPLTEGGTPVIIHSKVTVIDDRLLRIGSANLNNRSMGFDTECDLAIEAVAGEPGADRTSVEIRRFLDRLLTESLGALVGQVSAGLARTGSLVASIEALNRKSGRRLQSFDASGGGAIGSAIGASHLMDPYGAVDAWRPWKRYRGNRCRKMP